MALNDPSSNLNFTLSILLKNPFTVPFIVKTLSIVKRPSVGSLIFTSGNVSPFNEAQNPNVKLDAPSPKVVLKPSELPNDQSACPFVVEKFPVSPLPFVTALTLSANTLVPSVSFNSIASMLFPVFSFELFPSLKHWAVI